MFFTCELFPCHLTVLLDVAIGACVGFAVFVVVGGLWLLRK